MNFSEALTACKQGQKITRTGWNGPGQYVVHQKGYPDGIAINANTAEATGIPQGTVWQVRPVPHDPQRAGRIRPVAGQPG